ncbi:MAG TPA: helix-turn-helix transcriptional regulator [Flavisolibacter sp.]|jgi:transcriptional regulator with XRE-family HTH domain|nr:helix-turn-helix transcriptional regulator [Flavisolibacter sp.]
MKEKAIHIGRNIKKIREFRGYRQDFLASELGISQQTMSDLEAREKVNEEQLEKIAQILNTTPEYIKNFDEDKVITNNYYNQEGSFPNNQGSYLQSFNRECTLNPIDELLKLVNENKELYERLLKAEKEKNELLEKLLKK